MIGKVPAASLNLISTLGDRQEPCILGVQCMEWNIKFMEIGCSFVKVLAFYCTAFDVSVMHTLLSVFVYLYQNCFPLYHCDYDKFIYI